MQVCPWVVTCLTKQHNMLFNLPVNPQTDGVDVAARVKLG